MSTLRFYFAKVQCFISSFRNEGNTLQVLEFARDRQFDAQTCKIRDSDIRTCADVQIRSQIPYAAVSGACLHANVDMAHCQRRMALGATYFCTKPPRLSLFVEKAPRLQNKKGTLYVSPSCQHVVGLRNEKVKCVPEGSKVPPHALPGTLVCPS